MRVILIAIGIHTTFKRAASWNKWTDDEKVIQLAGHLDKRHY